MTSEHEPVLVIGPGYKVIINGSPTPIFGIDECPTDDPIMEKVFGPSPLKGNHNCIVLEKDRADVLVRFPTDKGVQEERWAIVRSQTEKFGLTLPATGLRRPDGSMVVLAAQS